MKLSYLVDFCSGLMILTTTYYQLTRLWRRTAIPKWVILGSSIIVIVGILVGQSSVVSLGYSLYVLSPRDKA